MIGICSAFDHNYKLSLYLLTPPPKKKLKTAHGVATELKCVVVSSGGTLIDSFLLFFFFVDFIVYQLSLTYDLQVKP